MTEDQFQSLCQVRDWILEGRWHRGSFYRNKLGPNGGVWHGCAIGLWHIANTGDLEQPSLDESLELQGLLKAPGPVAVINDAEGGRDRILRMISSAIADHEAVRAEFLVEEPMPVDEIVYA